MKLRNVKANFRKETKFKNKTFKSILIENRI